MPGSVPTDFDVNNLEQLRALVTDLRREGVRAFKHPSGLEVIFDRGALIQPPADSDGEF